MGATRVSRQISSADGPLTANSSVPTFLATIGGAGLQSSTT
jgi:hypothetical protein